MPTDVQSPISRKGGKPGSIHRIQVLHGQGYSLISRGDVLYGHCPDSSRATKSSVAFSNASYSEAEHVGSIS